MRDVSRVKRLNAQRMTKIGWEGLIDILDIDDRNKNDGDGSRSIAFVSPLNYWKVKPKTHLQSNDDSGLPRPTLRRVQPPLCLRCMLNLYSPHRLRAD